MTVEMPVQKKSWRDNLFAINVTPDQLELPNLLYQPSPIEVWKNTTQPFPVRDLLMDPESYRGGGEADMMVYYPRDFFAGLKGYNLGHEELWTPEAMAQRGVIDLSVFSQDASYISTEITLLARKLIKGEASYDDPKFHDKYTELTRQAYALMDREAQRFGLEKEGKTPVVLLRAGEPATQYTYGEGYRKDDTIRIDEKRGHLKGEEKGDVALMMYGVDEERMRQLDGQDLIICDPAFATGSSLLAVVMAMRRYGYQPRSIELRCLASTRVGLELTEQTLREMGIGFKAISLAVGCYLNDNYYIGGLHHEPMVGDAGDALLGTRGK